MPAFRSSKPKWKFLQSTPQTVAAGFQTLLWDTVLFEDPAGWDGVSSYVVDRPGLYLIGAQALRSSVASASTSTLFLRRNNSSTDAIQSLSTTAGVATHLSTIMELEEGDEMEVNVIFHTTLSATTVVSQTKFWGSRIGPKRWT